MEHSVSYAGNKAIYETDGDDGVTSKLKTKSNNKYNTKSTVPIREEDEYDDADMGLSKKVTGKIDDKNYFKLSGIGESQG